MSDWWSKKLNTPRHDPPPASRPPDRVLPAMPPPQQRVTPSVTVTPDNFAEASTHWQGGDATRTEHGSCPNCGSDLYFSRANAGTLISQNGQAAPAPRCYACGFTPGREMQGVPPA
jgi:hypothetical protein